LQTLFSNAQAFAVTAQAVGAAAQALSEMAQAIAAAAHCAGHPGEPWSRGGLRTRMARSNSSTSCKLRTGGSFESFFGNLMNETSSGRPSVLRYRNNPTYRAIRASA
jgi:hypothetical protein